MILGSHNSWSFLPPKHWWQRPFRFMAKCQRKTIQEQYDLGVRCFDLRIRYIKWKLQVAHGWMVYDITKKQLVDDWQFLNDKGDCYWKSRARLTPEGKAALTPENLLFLTHIKS